MDASTLLPLYRGCDVGHTIKDTQLPVINGKYLILSKSRETGNPCKTRHRGPEYYAQLSK